MSNVALIVLSLVCAGGAWMKLSYATESAKAAAEALARELAEQRAHAASLAVEENRLVDELKAAKAALAESLEIWPEGESFFLFPRAWLGKVTFRAFEAAIPQRLPQDAPEHILKLWETGEIFSQPPVHKLAESTADLFSLTAQERAAVEDAVLTMWRSIAKEYQRRPSRLRGHQHRQ